MKALILFFVLFTTQLYPQPVITFLNIPDSSTTISQRSCQNVDLIITPPGPNQLWDYSDLDSCNTLPVYATTFFGCSPDMYQSTSFDTANIVTNEYLYFQISPDIYREFGRNPLSYIISTNDPRDILRLPVNYLDSFSDYHSFSVTTPRTGGNTIGTSYVVADAWGTLITNAVTLNDVLRIRTYTVTDGSYVDSHGNPYYNHSVSITYSFFSATARCPVLEIQTDSIENITRIYYQDFLNPVFESTTNPYFKISPNPSTGKFSISNARNEEIEITIYNSVGKKVYKTLSESNKKDIDLTEENNGIYFCVIIDENNSVITKKLIIHD